MFGLVVYIFYDNPQNVSTQVGTATLGKHAIMAEGGGIGPRSHLRNYGS
jgi:hypothetical protein